MHNADLKYSSKYYNNLANSTYLIRGFTTFVLITIVAFVLVFKLEDIEKFIELAHHVNVNFLWVILALTLLDMYLDTSRYFVIAKTINPQINFKLVFNSNMADSFGSAVTPFQVGGGVAMIYVLNKGGVSYANGLSICIVTFVMSLLLILISSSISVIVLQDYFSSLIYNYLLNYSLIIFLPILIIISISLLKPEILLFRVKRILSEKIKTSNKYFLKILILTQSFVLVCEGYNFTCRNLITRYPKSLIISFVFTVLYYLNRFLIAYVLVIALGGEVGVIEIIAIQSLVLLLSFFAPTPGGSGFVELSIGALMINILNSVQLLSFTFLYRFLLFYFYIFIGSFVVYKVFKVQFTKRKNRNALFKM